MIYLLVIQFFLQFFLIISSTTQIKRKKCIKGSKIDQKQKNEYFQIYKIFKHSSDKISIKIFLSQGMDTIFSEIVKN